MLDARAARQLKKQLSRAFSGFVLHKRLNLGIADAAQSVVHDFDDTEAQESETDVKAKANQAVIWCKNASDYAAKVGGKPWAYLLIPHDAVAPNVTLSALRGRFELVS